MPHIASVKSHFKQFTYFCRKLAKVAKCAFFWHNFLGSKTAATVFFLTNPCLGPLFSSVSKNLCSSFVFASKVFDVQLHLCLSASWSLSLHLKVGVHLCLCLEVGVVPGLALLVLGLVIGALQEGHAALSRLREL